MALPVVVEVAILERIARLNQRIEADCVDPKCCLPVSDEIVALDEWLTSQKGE